MRLKPPFVQLLRREQLEFTARSLGLSAIGMAALCVFWTAAVWCLLEGAIVQDGVPMRSSAVKSVVDLLFAMPSEHRWTATILFVLGILSWLFLGFVLAARLDRAIRQLLIRVGVLDQSRDFLLPNEGDALPEIRKYLELIDDRTGHMLLTWTSEVIRILNHEMGKPLKTVDLDNVEQLRRAVTTSRDLIDELHALAAGGHVSLKPIDVTATTATIVTSYLRADRQRVCLAPPAHDDMNALSPSGIATRAIANVIDNALKHTSGRVTIRASRDDSRNTIILRVEDEGERLHFDEAQNLFRLRRHTGPSGLGLATTRILLRQIKGDILYEPPTPSTPNKAFVVVLPAAIHHPNNS